MLVDVFKESQPVMQYQDYLNDPEKYLGLNDKTIWDLLNSECSELASTRELLEWIQNRGSGDIYKLRKELILKNSKVPADEIFTQEKICAYGEITPDDLRVVAWTITVNPK